MRVPNLYDIHSNLPALEAVQTHVQHAQVDRVAILKNFSAAELK